MVGLALFVFQMSGYFNDKAGKEKASMNTNQTSSQMHKHGVGPMHIDQRTEPIKVEKQMHRHGGGPMHVDREVKPVEDEKKYLRIVDMGISMADMDMLIRKF